MHCYILCIYLLLQALQKTTRERREVPPSTRSALCFCSYDQQIKGQSFGRTRSQIAIAQPGFWEAYGQRKRVTLLLKRTTMCKKKLTNWVPFIWKLTMWFLKWISWSKIAWTTGKSFMQLQLNTSRKKNSFRLTLKVSLFTPAIYVEETKKNSQVIFMWRKKAFQNSCHWDLLRCTAQRTRENVSWKLPSASILQKNLDPKILRVWKEHKTLSVKDFSLLPVPGFLSQNLPKKETATQVSIWKPSHRWQKNRRKFWTAAKNFLNRCMNYWAESKVSSLKIQWCWKICPNEFFTFSKLILENLVKWVHPFTGPYHTQRSLPSTTKKKVSQ